jgi:hypothetical protein
LHNHLPDVAPVKRDKDHQNKVSDLSKAKAVLVKELEDVKASLSHSLGIEKRNKELVMRLQMLEVYNAGLTKEF